MAPPQALVHLALLSGQAINGGASIVAKVGFPSVNPVMFALMRELCAAPLLTALAWVRHGTLKINVRASWFPLVLASGSLFGAQLLWTAGLKLSNPVIGSAWQPTQPIFVLGIAAAIGWEAVTVPKLLGVLCALAGGATMTFCGPQDGSSFAGGATKEQVIGNLMFFLNCLSTALFVLVMRHLTRHHFPLVALALVYWGAALLIGACALIVGSSPELQLFFCPDCTNSFWTFPSGAFGALAYWVLGSSVLSYLCLTFGTRFAAEPTHCLMYTAIQPVVAGLIEMTLILVGWGAKHPAVKLVWPTTGQLFGACFIIAGIACIAREARTAASSSEGPPVLDSQRQLHVTCASSTRALVLSGDAEQRAL